MIQVTAEGRLTAQPELRYSQAGKPWATCTVVSNERRKNQAGDWEDVNTTFLNVKVFGNTAEAVVNLTKGTLVVVVGKLVQRDYEDKQGNKRTSYDLVASHVAETVRFAPSSAPAQPGGAGAASWGTSVPNASSGAPSGSQDAWAQPFDQSEASF